MKTSHFKIGFYLLLALPSVFFLALYPSCAKAQTAYTLSTGSKIRPEFYTSTNANVMVEGISAYATSSLTATLSPTTLTRSGIPSLGGNNTFTGSNEFSEISITSVLALPENSTAIYFSAILTATGSGTATNPYGLSGRDPGAFINGLNLTNSSTLIFLPGTYTFSTPINITTKDKWTFDGVSANGTVFVPSATFSSGANPSAIITSNAVAGASLKGTHTIQNITFNGNNNDAALGAIFLYSYGYNTVKNCLFVNWPKYVPDAYAIIIFKIDGNASGYANKSNAVSFCTFNDFAANTTATNSGIGGCIGAYSGNVPDAATQYTEVNVSNCTGMAGAGTTHAFWSSYGARGSLIGNYIQDFIRGAWQDTYTLNNFQVINNKFIVTTTVSSANQIWLTGSSSNLVISGNYFQDTFNATSSGVIYVDNAAYPLICNNSINYTPSNFSQFGVGSSCTRSSLIGNTIKINELNFPAGTVAVGNVIDASSISASTTSSSFMGNRTSLGASITALPDTLKPVNGTSTFSSGVVTATVSGLVPGQKLSITQHADGTVANTGVGVSYTVGSGFATFTSSNALANNSFDWAVSVSP